MKTIVFQGDSITDALRSREREEYRGCGYPTLVSAKLGYKYPGEYKFINSGVGGDRSVDILGRIKRDVINHNPDYVSLLFGVNDVWHELGKQNGVDTKYFEKIYEMIIEELREYLPEVKIMIMLPFLLKGEATEENFDEFKSAVVEKAEVAKKVALKYNIPYIDLQKKFDEMVKICPDSNWTVDGVHPKAPGHEIIARAWVEEFEKNLK